MNYLIDNQLPVGLVRHLQAHGLQASHVADWEWVQDRCLDFLDSPLPDVRNTAITCLGHLARIHKQLNRPKVLAALTSKLSDPQCAGRAEDAMEDIAMFARDEA